MTPPEPSSRASGRALGLPVAYALWIFGVLSYFIPPATWSPVSRFATTRAIVELGTVSIDAYAESTGDRALRAGHWYSDKAPVPALVAVPAYIAFRGFDRLRGGTPRFTAEGTADIPARHVYVNDSFRKGMYVCSLATAGAGGTAIAVLLFVLLRRRTSARTALVASACTVLGTPILPYATSFYGHVPAGALLLGALVALDDRRRDEGGNPVPGDAPDRGRYRVAGACLAAAVGCEYLVALPAVIVGVAALLRARDVRRAVLDLAVGAALPVAVVGAYHHAAFGAPWRTGYSFIARPEFAAGHASGLLGVHFPSAAGLYGLLFGERRGFFFVSPIAALATIAGVAAAYRTRDVTARLLFACTLALLWLNAGYYMWWGGAAAGPRHLVPAMASVGFGVAVAWDRPRLRLAVALAALFSGANALTLAAVGLEAPEHGNVLFDYAYRLLLEGKIAHMSGASNLAIELGLAPAGSLGPLLAWVLLGFRFLLRRAGEDDRTEDAATERKHPACSGMVRVG